MDDKEKMRLFIKDTIREIERFNMDITNLQLDINKLVHTNKNRYFQMCGEVKFPYSNYNEGVYIANNKSVLNTYTMEKLQNVVANTQKTLRKFMMLREIAVDKLNELTPNKLGGSDCG